ncbi:MAG: sodium:calcium antiporter [Candidatus Firestonebacteria bacterium]
MKKKKLGAWVWLLASLICGAQWVFFRLNGIQLDFPFDVLLPGIGILGAAFLISWAAELAQLEISQGLAVALLALITVLPEYTVDIYFAWMAGKEPHYISYATANMTGGNRLLIGAGWAAVVFFFWLKSGKKEIIIDKNHRVEMFALILATAYSFVIPLKGTLTILDSAVLLGIFALYMINASKTSTPAPEFEEGPPELIAALPRGPRLAVTIFLFIFSGLAIFLAAGPFAEGLLRAGRKLHIEEFLLVQWLAPLASEAPEFIVAILYAYRQKASQALGVFISSKVNQWTLLVGMLPLAYALSLGKVAPMLLDARQTEEILLTSAQSIFALVIISNMSFSLKRAGFIFLLFITQLFFTSPEIRYVYCGLYLAATLLLLVFVKSNRKGMADMFTKSWFSGRESQ